MLRKITIIQEFENAEIAKQAYELMKQNPTLPVQLPLPPRTVKASLSDNSVIIHIYFK